MPIVSLASEKLALANKSNAVAGKASGIGLINKEDTDIQSYVARKALDGLCLMIGEEEEKARRDPIGTGSAILEQVYRGLKRASRPQLSSGRAVHAATIMRSCRV